MCTCGKAMSCLQQPRLSLTEESPFNSARGGRLSPTQVAASISLRPSNVPGFNVRRQVPRLAGRPCGASSGRLAGCGKGAAHICTAGPTLSGHQDRQFAHRAARCIAEQALAVPFHAGEQPGGSCETYRSSLGCSDPDTALGPSAIVSLSLAVTGRAADHSAMLPGHSQLMSPCSAASASVSSLAHKPLEGLK